jgi:hypothetical protein
VILQDGTPVGNARTLLVSDETSRLYPSANQAKGIADTDDNQGARQGVFDSQHIRSHAAAGRIAAPNYF